MIIHYQNELHGTEISHSIGRYLKYSLDVQNIELTEINVYDRKKIIDGPNDIHILVLTNGLHDSTYWLTLLNQLKQDIITQECCINIIDLTWQYNFPITVSPVGIISILNDGCKAWLAKLTTEWLDRKTNLGIADYLPRNFFKAVQHEIEKPSSKYTSSKDYIRAYNWIYIEEDLLKLWRQTHDEED